MKPNKISKLIAIPLIALVVLGPVVFPIFKGTDNRARVQVSPCPECQPKNTPCPECGPRNTPRPTPLSATATPTPRPTPLRLTK